jgi:hypothetical protein
MRTTLTSAQPLGSRSPVLSHRQVQLSRSLSHCVTQENHLEYHIISTLCTEEANTSLSLGSCSHVLSHRHVQLRRSLSHRITQENHLEYHIISTLCTEEANTSFHLCLITIHPTHGLPYTGSHNIPSLSQRGTTYPAHGLPYIGAHNIPSSSQRGTTHRGTTFHLCLRGEPHTHLMGTPNSWALSQADSLSLCPGGCLTQL